jgi:hypothetical protein
VALPAPVWLAHVTAAEREDASCVALPARTGGDEQRNAAACDFATAVLKTNEVKSAPAPAQGETAARVHSTSWPRRTPETLLCVDVCYALSVLRAAI